MIDTTLQLHMLNEDMAMFMGDFEETKEEQGFLGGTVERRFKFPCFQVSRDKWEEYGCPVYIRVQVSEVTSHFNG